MAVGDSQINFRPEFQTDTLPCSAQVGDLIVLTPLKDGEPDPRNDLGAASVWICTRADFEGRPAVWQRVAFDGWATCQAPVQKPPQNRPRLNRG